FGYNEIAQDKNFVLLTQKGMIKQTKMSEFAPWRTYKSRSLSAMKFKEKNDQLVNAYLVDANEKMDVFLASHRAFGLRYELEEVPVVGAKAAGVKSINLKEDDYVVNGLLVYSQGDNPVVIVTQR